MISSIVPSITSIRHRPGYQSYLDRWWDGTNAVGNLCDFLDVEELDDVVLNAGNEQRLVLIAANFRKVVTSAVLWLLRHGVRGQCFRVVPYSFGEDLFIDLQQIIPTPEAADYMIGMAAKGSEAESVEGARKRSDRVRHAFRAKALEELRTRKVSRFENISPSTDHWLSCATGVSGCAYSLIFLKNETRSELSLQRSVRFHGVRRLPGLAFGPQRSVLPMRTRQGRTHR